MWFDCLVLLNNSYCSCYFWAHVNEVYARKHCCCIMTVCGRQHGGPPVFCSLCRDTFRYIVYGWLDVTMTAVKCEQNTVILLSYEREVSENVAVLPVLWIWNSLPFIFCNSFINLSSKCLVSLQFMSPFSRLTFSQIDYDPRDNIHLQGFVTLKLMCPSSTCSIITVAHSMHRLHGHSSSLYTNRVDPWLRLKFNITVINKLF